ncbi:S-adenosylmethionine--tRNA ribosyltransferase-isomerase [Geoalkalibacter ferrihydriticus]|uniref:S-adenosylmethionine:tRNA ribosyltransferase-isomerase n=2 Tax=Geoalkalibacter ferrihydriticus TaxID=392333 RepID=A0A0C2HUX9_9BACT|nr:tRNA preQ1(34) S-adenosylmethionine ribosyltransferase-isomerase QueA [Geoalkalibacter ferrihydriticus]KIH76612.1 S-adenosylmethionine:tRNA ribosyltransferase-isomerase [Geoalkalibacter ferrihydriticus DSM 17813]SDM03538.1 S-adenosylmethionine--tRNA ribosyltransferase-isomerase [Geoalkalibacter ferrihydriticus]
MHLNDFNFELPEHLIAQHPAQQRDGSRLMTLDRAAGSLHPGYFPDVVGAFRPGDLLVINDTRVIPARLLGRKVSGGRIEVFLVRRLVGEDETWLCLTRSSKPARPGTRVLFEGGLEGEVLGADEQEPGQRRVRFKVQGEFLQVLEKVGRMPLPPYISRPDHNLDRERYQTVFAQEPGAVAAPTAGLHFTEPILRQLREVGVDICPLTLHVGPGTFLPVRVDDIRDHRMHAEHYRVPVATAEAVNRAKQQGRRVFALGTTATRVLEFALDDAGRLLPGEGVSDLFIYPGFRFRVVDGLITNFHLPRSTLLMLVCAFAGRELTLEAYRRAVEEQFRFFSYGDCMLIL